MLRAPLVISDAGVANTFGRLVPQAVGGAHGLARGARRAAAVDRARLCLYVGLRSTTAARARPAAREPLDLTPSDDHDAHLCRGGRPRGALPSLHLLPVGQGSGLRAPLPGSGDDRRDRPCCPGTRFAAWEDTRWHKRGADYDAAKRALTQRLLDVLYAHVPQVRGRVEVAELSTPLTTRHFAAHPQGEIYGLAHTPARFATRAAPADTPCAGCSSPAPTSPPAASAAPSSAAPSVPPPILRRNLIDAALRARGERAAA